MAKTFKQTRRLTKMVSKKLENWIDITILEGDAYNAYNLEKATLKLDKRKIKWQKKLDNLKPPVLPEEEEEA